jgi:hypothetical protein
MSYTTVHDSRGGVRVQKYLVLYKSSATAAQQMAAGDPAQAEASMGLWMTWMEKAGSALVDPGSPLGDGTELPSSGTRPSQPVGGYSILQAESMQDVESLLDGHPHYHSPDASIEVYEFLAMPGMS